MRCTQHLGATLSTSPRAGRRPQAFFGLCFGSSIPGMAPLLAQLKTRHKVLCQGTQQSFCALKLSPLASLKNKPCLAAPAFCCGLPGPSHLQPSPCSSSSQPHHFAGMWKPRLPQNTTRSMAASSLAASGFPLTVIPAPAQIAAQTAAQQHIWLLQHSDKFG